MRRSIGKLNALNTLNAMNAINSTGYQGDWAVYPFLGNDRILLGDMNTGMYVVDVTRIESPLKNQVSDFDGDGKPDISVYRPGPGDWHVMSSATGATTSTHFGLTGDQVVAGDYDGDGKSDLAVFRHQKEIGTSSEAPPGLPGCTSV